MTRRAVGYTWTDQPMTGWGTFAAALSARCAEHGLPCARVTTGHFDGTLLHGFGEGLQVLPDVTGAHEIAVGFLETPALVTPRAVAAHAARFPMTLAGSTWLAGVLRDAGVPNVHVALQGVHAPVVVPPSPRWAGHDPVVFSGGKLEYRKGQDRVVAMFRRLLQTHPRALLVTAWQNGYDATVESLQKSHRTFSRPARDPDTGLLDIVTWAEMNGLPRDRVVDLGWVTPDAWPQVWADVDVAWMPSRSEGGTNLVAMEALAHGVPVVATVDTGHADLEPWLWGRWDDAQLPSLNWPRASGGAFADAWAWPARIDHLLTLAGVLP
jgi:glycosyltransferase involved in cell wall biosynthesis